MDIAPGLTLDADYLAGRSCAVLGKRGVGKSTTCRVLAEELDVAKVQTLIIDPMGVFWGLRADTVGNPSGVPIPVFGGRRGDAPLEPSAGQLMADLAVERELSMVLDLSEFANRAQEFDFVSAFLDRLFRKSTTGLTHVIVDEADHFAPQKPVQGSQQVLEAMINLVRRGRNKGLGITMASQRTASLSKDVLSQVDVLAAMRVTAPADRDAIAAWVRGQGDPETWPKIAETLPKLTVGEAWWWIPEHDILTRAKVRRSRTFDTSPTRSRRNSAAREPKSLTEVDLARIADQIAATRERAAANDPRALAARIRDLEAENQRLQRSASGPAASPAEPRTVEVPVEVPVPYIPEVVTVGLAALRERAETTAREAGEIASALDELLRAAADIPAPTKTTTKPAPRPRPTGAAPQQVAPPAPAGSDHQAAESPNATPLRFRAGAHRMIESLGRMAPLRLTKAQWGLVSGLKHTGGTWSTYLGEIRRAGLITEDQAGFTLTDAGWAYLGERPDPMTAEELQQHYLSILRAGARRMLQACIDAYPNELSKERLSELAEVTLSGGTFSTYLGILRRNSLVEQGTDGAIVATEILMRGAATYY